MGRLATIVALLIASTTTAFAEDAIDPTVWSRDQWRSDLFHTYATHRDAPSRPVARHTVIEQTVVIRKDETPAQRAVVPVRPKLIVIGGRSVNQDVSVTRPGHTCDGILTLTWMGNHAEPRCNRSSSRLTSTGR